MFQSVASLPSDVETTLAKAFFFNPIKSRDIVSLASCVEKVKKETTPLKKVFLPYHDRWFEPLIFGLKKKGQKTEKVSLEALLFGLQFRTLFGCLESVS